MDKYLKKDPISSCFKKRKINTFQSPKHQLRFGTECIYLKGLFDTSLNQHTHLDQNGRMILFGVMNKYPQESVQI